MKKKPAVRHRLSTVQRIFFSYVFICLVPVVILAGVLAVSTFRAQQREDGYCERTGYVAPTNEELEKKFPYNPYRTNARFILAWR